MCGRYALVSGKKVFLTFNMMKQMREKGTPFDLLPRYNAAPMQVMPVAAVRNDTLTLEKMRWWLIPHWSKEGKGDPRFPSFNARAETIGKSKLFAPYFTSSRCLVPADGFYEWKKTSLVKEVRGRQKAVVEKQPMLIRMKDETLFMFAGLFSVWKNDRGEEFPSFTIITTEPNELVRDIHNRMPVILPEQHFEQWLDRDFKETAALQKLLLPYPARKMKAFPVSSIVGNSRNDVPECMEPVKNN